MGRGRSSRKLYELAAAKLDEEKSSNKLLGIKALSSLGDKDKVFGTGSREEPLILELPSHDREGVRLWGMGR